MIGAQKISELTAVSATGAEYIPCIIPDGLGGWTNGRVHISGIGSDTNLGNTNLTQTDTIRTYNINGNMLQFDNGQVVIGSPLSSPSKLEVVASGSTRAIAALSSGSVAVAGRDNTGQGFQGSTVSGFGVLGTASGSGTGLYGQSVGGVAGHMDGGLLVETYAFGSSPTPSSVATFNATNKGVLIPRLTTTQRDAISSPAIGLEIFNTTTNRKEFYNGTYWAGEKQIINIFHGANWFPVDGQTVVFSGTMLTPQVSPYSGAMQLKLSGAGVIRYCRLTSIALTAVGSNEAWSLYIRINSTDYLVATVTTNSSGVRLFENLSLNIPYVDGDLFQMVFVNPTWATNPGGVVSYGTVTIE